MSDDSEALDFVTVAELDDSVRAQMLLSFLEEHDIPVQSPGMNHRAMLGYQVHVYLKVPREREDEARGIVAAFYGDAELPGEIVGPYRRTPRADEDETAPPLTTRRRRVVAFCALSLTFGTGHFYVGEPGAGWALFASQCVAILVGLSGPAWRGALLAVPLLIAYDLVDGIAAVRRLERGAPRSTPAQALAALLFALSAVGVGGLLGPSVAAWAERADADARAAPAQ